MPNETLIVVSAVVAVFAAFMVVLAWAEARTRNTTPSK
jgi:hypothetical protein